MKGSFTVSLEDIAKELKNQIESNCKREIAAVNLKIKLEDESVHDFKELFVEFETK